MDDKITIERGTLLPAHTIKRIKKECDALDLDIVAFAWRIQRAALAAQPADAWRMAVDAAMVGHALDCTTPDSDPAACVALLVKQVADIERDIVAPAQPADAQPAVRDIIAGWKSATFGWNGANPISYEKARANHAEECIRRIEATLAAPPAPAAVPQDEAWMHWNFDADKVHFLVCRDDHEKGDKCEYVPMPAEEILELVELLRSRAIERAHGIAAGDKP